MFLGFLYPSVGPCFRVFNIPACVVWHPRIFGRYVFRCCRPSTPSSKGSPPVSNFQLKRWDNSYATCTFCHYRPRMACCLPEKINIHGSSHLSGESKGGSAVGIYTVYKYIIFFLNVAHPSNNQPAISTAQAPALEALPAADGQKHTNTSTVQPLRWGLFFHVLLQLCKP